MKPNQVIEKQNSPKHAVQPEKAQRRHRLRDPIGRAALAMVGLFPAAANAAPAIPTAVVSTIPALDFFGAFDIGAVKAYQVSNEHIHTGSHLEDTAIDNAVVGSIALGTGAALGLAITKTKRLKGSKKSMDDYHEHKRSIRSRPAKIAVGVLSSPLWVLEKAGNIAEKAGDKVSQRRSRLARSIGHVLVDTGQVLAVASTGVVMDETMKGNPPSNRRNLRLAALGSGAVLGLIGAAREVEQNVPQVDPVMGAIAHGFDLATTINFAEPWQTPIGFAAVSLAVAGMAYSGWKTARFHDQQQQAQIPMSEQPMNQPTV